MKDLNALNETLFATLEKVTRNEIDHKKVTSIVNISNSIISNGKLQLQAYKMAKANLTPQMIGIEHGTNGAPKKPYLISEIQSVKEKPKDISIEVFVRKLGYDSVTEARADMGAALLESKYTTWKANQ
jgi:hypothetical protein